LRLQFNSNLICCVITDRIRHASKRCLGKLNAKNSLAGYSYSLSFALSFSFSRTPIQSLLNADFAHGSHYPFFLFTSLLIQLYNQLYNYILIHIHAHTHACANINMYACTNTCQIRNRAESDGDRRSIVSHRRLLPKSKGELKWQNAACRYYVVV